MNIKKLLGAFIGLFAVGLFFIASPAHAAVIETQTCAGKEVAIYGDSPALAPQIIPPQIGYVAPDAVDATRHCAVIRWATNAPATSQIVYMPLESFKGIDATKTNLGLTQATTQNNSGAVLHKAILTQLTPGTRYIFYVVARSYPSAVPTVSGPFYVTIHSIPTTPQRTARTAQYRPVKYVSKSAHTEITASVITAQKKTTIKDVGVTAQSTQEQTDATHRETSATSTKATSTTIASLYDTLPLASTTQIHRDSEILRGIPSALTATVQAHSHFSFITWLKTLWNKIKVFFVSSIVKKSHVNTEVEERNGGDTKNASPVLKKDKKDILLPGNTILRHENHSVNTDSRSTSPADNSPSFDWIQRFAFLVPTVVIIGFLWLIQNFVLPHLNIVVERPRVFWMFSLLLFAVASVFLHSLRLTLVLLALFLLILAWHLLSGVIEEAIEEEGDAEKNTKLRDTGNKEGMTATGVPHIG